MGIRHSLHDIQRHYHSFDKIVINPLPKKNKQNNKQKTNGYSHDIIGWPSTLNKFNDLKKKNKSMGVYIVYKVRFFHVSVYFIFWMWWSFCKTL